MNGSFLEFIKEHKFTIILVLIGLILSILFSSQETKVVSRFSMKISAKSPPLDKA